MLNASFLERRAKRNPGMNYFKNPRWWTIDDDSAWENQKTQLRQEWDSKRSREGKLSLPAEHYAAAYRYGYGANIHFGGKYPQWNRDVESHAKADWMALYPERITDLQADLESIRFGWEYGQKLFPEKAAVEDTAIALGA